MKSDSGIFIIAKEFAIIENFVCIFANARYWRTSMQWNDLSVVLAICRAGTLAGAASSLGQNHSTVFRRINAIEERMGVRFFERLP
jgi:hypothetical protein